jgi:UDP-N-acetylmuramoyl-tripeptide--D-alanyl-D-alanine ligase
MIDPPLWTLDAMADAMHAERAGILPPAISGISIDTRIISPGEAFFALKGENRDGHAFVAPALKAGAGLAVIAADNRKSFDQHAPLLLVPDVLQALRELARAARARTQAKIVAVTGSVGKTGSKDALHLALGKQGKTHASAASYNNHFGVPLSLARCPAGARFAVFELGMNHAGEIAPLAQLVRPHVAMITTVEPVHLEFFSSVEAIADAKAEIFSGLVPGGAAVLNCDNTQFARLAGSAQRAGVERIVSFGECDSADARLIKCVLHASASTVEARIFDRDVHYEIGAPGRHVVQNSLGVLASVVLLGGELDLAAHALADLRPARGRGAQLDIELPGGTILLIDESYNANPASMRAALAALGRASGSGRRIAVLGDMLELGPRAADYHGTLADAVLSGAVDLVFCCGPLMRRLWEALPASRRGNFAENSAELTPHVLAAVRPGDILMVKGSLGSRMGAIVKALENLHRREAVAASLPELPS